MVPGMLIGDVDEFLAVRETPPLQTLHLAAGGGLVPADGPAAAAAPGASS
jgi:hypothetical protein